jgi:hypothetical protein
MTLKLGKHPPVFDDRTLNFHAYLRPGLPTPPASKMWGSKVRSWPMYDNHRYRDCTCAAAGHMIQNWTANAGSEVTLPDEDVVRFYEHFVGSPPPPDEGCNMLQVLKYWRRVGLGGHRVVGFAALELRNHLQAKGAAYLLGSIYIGVALPDFAVRGDILKVPWDVPAKGPVGDAAPNVQNGHSVAAVGYDARNLYIVTWGELKSMSWRFYDAYVDEAYAVLSEDFLNARGQAPEGFDLSALKADLASL